MISARTVRAIAVAAVFIAGCDRRPTPSSRPSSTASMNDSRQSAEVFAYVAGILNGLDQFDTAFANRDDTMKLNEAARRLLEAGVPPTVLSQLNQWAAIQPVVDGWHRDPLIGSLPDELQALPQLKQLQSRTFTTEDGFGLREAVWLRNISESAAGETQDDLEVAIRLFDWVVRNIQLDAEPPQDEGEPTAAPLPLLAWQALLFGHGHAIDRAWLFVLLARQQGLDVVVLTRPDGSQDTPAFWLPALLHDGELYLFDPALALPLPGPDSAGVATLSQAAEDDAVLRQLDLDDERRYPLDKSDFAEVAALVEASPLYLCERMALVESQLSGEQKIVLSVNASGVAERIGTCAHVASVRLWPLPYERIEAIRAGGRKLTRRLVSELEPFAVPFFEKKGKGVDFAPALWRGRTLQLFAKYSGAESASPFYQAARPADTEMTRGMAGVFENVEMLMQVNPEEHRRSKAALEHFIECARVAKQDASFWLGLIAFERQDYPTAIDYLMKRTLAAAPDGPWTNGAYYNLARCYEASGQVEEAIEVYRRVESPQQYGNLLRARRLEQH